MEELYDWNLISGEENAEMPEGEQPPEAKRIPTPDISNEFDIREYAIQRSRELAFLWTAGSSNVRKFTYDRSAFQLHVWFQPNRGRTIPPMSHYVYFDVPYDVFLQMVNAPSKGKFVHQVLSGYGYLRI